MSLEMDDTIKNVLKCNHLGGAPSSYEVFFTAERVMLVFGLLPGQHRDALKDLIARQTDEGWEESTELARVTEAKLVLGLPDAIISLKERLVKAGVNIPS